MLSLDQMRRELKAIEAFDNMFLENPPRHSEDLVGVLARMSRKRELLMFVKAVLEQN